MCFCGCWQPERAASDFYSEMLPPAGTGRPRFPNARSPQGLGFSAPTPAESQSPTPLSASPSTALSHPVSPRHPTRHTPACPAPARPVPGAPLGGAPEANVAHETLLGNGVASGFLNCRISSPASSGEKVTVAYISYLHDSPKLLCVRIVVGGSAETEVCELLSWRS